MPSLRERIDNLRLKFGEIVTEDWFDGLGDVLDDLAFYGAVDYLGYVHHDLIPDRDLAVSLGTPLRRFKEINAGLGYFTYDAFVQGKKVLKDGDPINIAYFFPYALQQLADELGSFKPEQLAGVVNAPAYPLQDIFPNDIPMPDDGRVRVKIKVVSAVYAYLKHYFASLQAEDIGLLNDGAPLPANVFKEFDETVSKGDKINVRFSNSTKATVIMYNIPSA